MACRSPPLALAIWLYLVFARGGFWLVPRARRRRAVAPPAVPPSVAIVVPARNEADSIAESVDVAAAAGLSGAARSSLVDDDSNDGTADVARRGRRGARRAASGSRSSPAQPLPRGWTGKLWAVKQGIEAARGGVRADTYLLLTDADIVYAPDTLSWLVAQAEASKLVLTSLMVKLRCESLAERVLIPAFIFFFQMLYPFAWVNRPRQRDRGRGRRLHAGARATRCAPRAASRSIRDALIDDCALREAAEGAGPDLARPHRARRTASAPTRTSSDIRRMVARSAYAQLRYSPLLLAGTVVGHGAHLSRAAAAGAVRQRPGRSWLGLAGLGADGARVPADAAVLPASRRLWGLALPAIALLYMLFTLDSAYQYAARQGRRLEGPRAGEGTMTHDRRRDLRSGKGHRDENFPGRVAADPSAPSRRHPGVLRIRAHRRRHRRSRDA